MTHSAEISIGLQRNPKDALTAALSKLVTPIDMPKNLFQVLLKPSIYDPSLVGNTEPELVRAVARTFNNLGPISIIESDNPVRTTNEAFEKTGYNNLANDNVKLVNLTEIPRHQIKMSGHYFETLEMPSLLTEPSFFVNVPTVKLEPAICTFGGGIKNLFGLIPDPDKHNYHSWIDDVLLDLLIAFKPHLTIVDLTTMVIGNRKDGITKNIGAVIVSTDPLAADAFCADLFGVDPMKVSHLRKAFDLGLGEILVDRIRISGTETQRGKLFELCRV